MIVLENEEKEAHKKRCEMREFLWSLMGLKRKTNDK